MTSYDLQAENRKQGHSVDSRSSSLYTHSSIVDLLVIFIYNMCIADEMNPECSSYYFIVIITIA